MNLACPFNCLKLFMNIEMRYSGEKKILDNFKYLVTVHMHHFRERFTFLSTFLLQVYFLGNLRLHTQLLRVNMIGWKSNKNQ